MLLEGQNLHSWQRGSNLRWFIPPFSKFVQLSCSLLPPTRTSTAVDVVLFLGWMGEHDIWCAILLNDVMDLHMSSLGTLVPEGPWCVFYARRHQVYWGLKIMPFANTFIWYHTHGNTHTYTDIEHIQWSVDWHTSVLTSPEG